MIMSYASIWLVIYSHYLFLVTASHLPDDKNGLKFFGKKGGLTKSDIDELIMIAQTEARHWYDMGILPPSSGSSGVLCSALVRILHYACIIKHASVGLDSD